MEEIHTHGFVRLDDAMATDLSVVNSARVSFAKRSEEMTDAEVGLINFLMRERHGTPFEHNSFRFNIRCPISIAREWFRHRVSSFNEESLRYSRARLEGFIPEAEAVRTQVGKPGSYTFEQMGPGFQELVPAIIQNTYEECFKAYDYMVRLGVAKELARFVLPLGMFTEFYWTVNARSLMNFLSLRNEGNAQLEIQQYADPVEKVFAEKMPVTHQAFIKNGRRAP